MKRVLATVLGLGATATLAFALPAQAADDGAANAAKKKSKTYTVCKHGCKYKTIQKAVNKSGKNAIIKVKPGKYAEGVIVEGHKHDGLTIMGTSKNAKKVKLEGKNATNKNGVAQNGIEGIDVKRLTLKNMYARNYATNGFFVRDSNPGPGEKIDCSNYLMKNLVASFNRAYGMYAFGCTGGRITQSEGWGHGDSAFYIGGTPTQKNPKKTTLDHLDAHENVLGYSGTNSRYVVIRDSYWYNNGVGLVPNTLDSEPFEPATGGTIRDNYIFWNNFNYFLPSSRVQTISSGLGSIGDLTIQFPTGVGVALFGATDWTVRDNMIFGNEKWGTALFSDPFNEDDDAISTGNQVINNSNGRNGSDPNAVDFWNDGSGSGNCFSGNSSSTFDPSGTATNAFLYPGCPAPNPPAAGTGTSSGDGDQLGELIGYVTTDPPENQQCSWTEANHPKFEGFTPLDVSPGPVCP